MPSTRAIAETTDDGNRISQQGLAAVGVEVGQSAAPAAPKTRTPRTGTKQALLIDMLRREKGATIEEVVVATGWQSHTVRGAISGALKKKLGLDVGSEGRGPRAGLPDRVASRHSVSILRRRLDVRGVLRRCSRSPCRLEMSRLSLFCFGGVAAVAAVCGQPICGSEGC